MLCGASVGVGRVLEEEQRDAAFGALLHVVCGLLRAAGVHPLTSPCHNTNWVPECICVGIGSVYEWVCMYSIRMLQNFQIGIFKFTLN